MSTKESEELLDRLERTIQLSTPTPSLNLAEARRLLSEHDAKVRAEAQGARMSENVKPESLDADEVPNRIRATANETNCPVCGWTYETKPDGCGCWPGNCSMRPLPQYFTDPDRAIAEGYDPELVERHRRPPPPPCPECERLRAELARTSQEAWVKHMLQMARDGEVATLRKERDAALKALRSLTPGGSEYQTPEECAAFVRTSRDDVMRVLKDFKAQRDAALAERDEARAWIRKASGWPIAHETFCAKMRETAPARCSCGLDEFLAGGEKAKRAAMAPLDAALARAEEADKLLEHAITYIAPAKDFGPMMEGACSACNAMISKFECESAFLCSECLTRKIDAHLKEKSPHEPR